MSLWEWYSNTKNESTERQKHIQAINDALYLVARCDPSPQQIKEAAEVLRKALN